jgi:hypothetical protein
LSVEGAAVFKRHHASSCKGSELSKSRTDWLRCDRTFSEAV